MSLTLGGGPLAGRPNGSSNYTIESPAHRILPRHLSLAVDGARLDDSAWVYDTPLPEAAKVAGHVAFEGEGIEIELSEPAA